MGWTKQAGAVGSRGTRPTGGRRSRAPRGLNPASHPWHQGRTRPLPGMPRAGDAGAMIRTPLPRPHEGPLRPSFTHRRPLSAAISAFRCRAGREAVLGAAIYRFSRAVREPPTIQTNRKPWRPLHPSPVRQRTLRLRIASPSSTPTRGLPRPSRRRCARRHGALALDVPSNGMRERTWRKGKGRG